MSDVQDRLRNIEDTLQVIADQLLQINGGVPVTAHQKRYALYAPGAMSESDYESLQEAVRDWRDGGLPVLVLHGGWRLEEVRDGPVEVKQEEAEVLPMFVVDEAIGANYSCAVGPDGGLVRVPLPSGTESIIGTAWVDLPKGAKVTLSHGFLHPVVEE